LKRLCDQGATLLYKGSKLVTNVYVVNTVAFDVSGLDCMRFVTRSGHESPVLATHAVLDDHATSRFDERAMREFGWGQSASWSTDSQYAEKVMQALRDGDIGRTAGGLDAYRSSVPHWWVAVECDDSLVVHLDLCAAAYSWPLVEFQGTPVSFAAIESPLYAVAKSKGGHVKHKFHYRSYVVTAAAAAGAQRLAPLAPPKHAARHLGALARNDGTTVEITPLQTFLDNFKASSHDVSFFGSRVPPVDAFAADKMRQDLAPGTRVVLGGLRSRRDLNGRPARVVNRDGNRIGVSVLLESGAADEANDDTPEQSNKPIAVKPESLVVLDTVADHEPLYRSLEDMMARVDRENPKPPPAPRPSGHDLAKMRAVDWNDPDVVNVLRRIRSGNFLFSHCADPGVLRGLGILVESGLTKGFGEEAARLHRMLALAKEPRAKDAMSLMTLLSKAKEQAVDAGELTRHPSGAYLGHSDSFLRARRSVANRLNTDHDLMAIFDKLENEGLYVNPARHAL